MNFTCVDIGASNTRYGSSAGRFGQLPNNMVKIENVAETNPLQPSDDSIEQALEVVITKTSGSDSSYSGLANAFPARVLYGRIAERHSSVTDRPNGLTHKHKQEINIYSAIIQAAVARLRDNVEEDINLYVAVPPVEVDVAGQLLNEVFTGTFEVAFPKYKGGIVVKLNIHSVKCYAESQCATVSFFLTTECKPNERAAKYFKGILMSIDIGASTSDIVICKDGVYQESSKQTYKIGGNSAREYLTDYIRETYEFDITIEEAEHAMATGRMSYGSGLKDVSELVAKAKKRLAAELNQNINNYFRSKNIPIQQIAAILVSGGGSLAGSWVNETQEVVETSKPLSEYLTEHIHKVCDTVDVIAYGADARMANVRGLYIIAMSEMRKEEAAARAAQAQATAAQAQATAAQAQVQQTVAQTVQEPAVAQTLGQAIPVATADTYAGTPINFNS